MLEGAQTLQKETTSKEKIIADLLQKIDKKSAIYCEKT